MKDGSIISDEINVADAHPSGKRPFKRKQYIQKFKNLTEGIISDKESDRFLKIAQNLKSLKSKDIMGLNIELSPSILKKIRKKSSSSSIF